MRKILLPFFSKRRHLHAAIIALLFFFLAGSRAIFAKPTTRQQAEKSVQGWLKANPAPLDTALAGQVRDVRPYYDAQNELVYYVVSFDPDGFVILPADDLIQPIIAFAPTGNYDPSNTNPLGELVSRDLPQRLKMVRNLPAELAKLPNERRTALIKNTQTAQGRWKYLRNLADGSESPDGDAGETGLSGVSDVRVAPLVASTWDQDYVGIYTCYNYYTPNNYVCGCVATAMAQIMRYHQHPAAGVGTPSFTIWVNDVEQSRSLRGGDGSGGPYNWSQMPLTPSGWTITTTQRRAIGALCHDAGVSVSMSYKSGASSAYTVDAAARLKDTFQYSNAVYLWWPGVGTELNRTLNPNLDAGYPCQLAISGEGGHSIVCDGYGYNCSALYHHLNLGWGGSQTAWYNLPTVDAGDGYNTVKACVYNIYVTGTGEIISGRVVDTDGMPIAGVTVTATGGGTAVTNARGIYALAKVPSNTAYTVTAFKSGWLFPSSQIVTTGLSQNDSACGNRWGMDFTGSHNPISLDKSVYAAPDTLVVNLNDTDILSQGTQEVTLQSCGDYETLLLMENPAHSGLFSGSISIVYSSVSPENGIMEATGSQVITATYHDGDNGTGTAETIRAAAEIKPWFSIIETGFTGGLPAGWSIVDGLLDGKTWQTAQESSYPDYQAFIAGTFMVCNSDTAGEVAMDEELISAPCNCTEFDGVALQFSHFFRHYEAEIADVDVRVNGGRWQNLARYTGTEYQGTVLLDLTAIAAGQSNVQIRWHYYNANWEWYWGVDHVKMLGRYPVQPMPSDLSGDCRVDIEDLIIFAENWLVHY